MTKEEIQKRVSKIPRWRHQIALPHGVNTPGLINTPKEFERYGVPDSLAGKRVLDIGCSDGFYSFECEKRNAREVLAIDDESSLLASGVNGFMTVKDIIGSKVEYKHMSVYDLNPKNHGKFDIVFFLNVFYHLRHPLFGLDRIYEVMNPSAVLYFKSFFEFDFGFTLFKRRLGIGWNRRPWARFYPKNELAGDPTNWWGPNIKCIREMLKSSGFHIEKNLGRTYDRVYFRCRRVSTRTPELLI